MNNVVEFLKKYSNWILFAILEVIAFVLLFQYNRYQGSVWFSSANAVAGKAYEWSSSIEQYFALAELNKELTQRNVQLESELNAMREKLKDDGIDDEVLAQVSAEVRSNMQFIPARVVSNTIVRRDNFITIDRGSLDGITPDMGVISGSGIVGIVYQTSPHYSVVIPILSSHSNISCSIEGRDYFGYLRWELGSSRTAYLDNVPRHAKYRLYDKVVTSGYSSVFPRGILVGKIMHVYNSPDGLSYRMQIHLSTNFANLRDVCVIKDNTMRERLDVMRAAEDSIKLTKEGGQ